MIPALKTHLFIYVKKGSPATAHAIQAILILFYGGLDKTWPIVQAAYKGRPKFDWNKTETAPAVAGWVDAVVKALEGHRTVAEGADNPDLEFAGEPATTPPAPLVLWKPTSQRSGITARKIAMLGKAQDSVDPREVLGAHFLAKSLGLEGTAEALGRRHAALTAKA